MVTPLLPVLRKALLLMTLLFVSFLSVSSTQAADTEQRLSISISPVLFKLTANPGETVTNTVKVTNASADRTQEIEMGVEPFTGTETGEAIVSETGNPAYSLKEWMTFSPSKMVLAAGESKIITYTIKIPNIAEPGGRYGSILASTPQSNLNNGTGVSTVQKIGSLVLLQVSGPIDYAATIKSFKPAQKIFERGPVKFTMRIHNDSTVHIQPKGFVTIADMFGHKVKDIEVPSKLILPKEDRLIDVNWNESVKIGRYTATMLLVYGDKESQITATQTFTVFPWKTGVPLIVLGLFFLWFIIAKRRNMSAAIKVLVSNK